MCDLIKLEYPILIIKYIIPSIIIFIGLIKLFTIKKKKKAIKKFLINILIGLILFLTSTFIELVINETCQEYNKPETKIDVDNKKNEEVKPIIKEEPTIEVIDGITYVDGILIVNKTYSLTENYMPENAENRERCNECLTLETKQAFNEMKTDAQSIGLNLYIASGYRSYSYQQGLYNRYVNKDGKQLADTYSARPGHSEHQTGLAFDLNSIDDSFANTPEGKWVKDNCYRYGLILRYPKGKEDKTGYQYESWHLRYVGKELAEKLYNNGEWITLEEHFNLTSVYE